VANDVPADFAALKGPLRMAAETLRTEKGVAWFRSRIAGYRLRGRKVGAEHHGSGSPKGTGSPRKRTKRRLATSSARAKRVGHSAFGIYGWQRRAPLEAEPSEQGALAENTPAP